MTVVFLNIWVSEGYLFAPNHYVKIKKGDKKKKIYFEQELIQKPTVEIKAN